jgi:tRNA(Ile)-lysidine synthase
MPAAPDIALIPPDLTPPDLIPTETPGAPLLVAYSGGLDSTVLLHLLADAAAPHGRHVRAIHVHHGLHAQADAWAQHCSAVCTTLGIALTQVAVHVERGSPLGPEGAARQARRAAFADALQPGEVLALAHHRDDQAETFLLRALRASGPDGLAAMRPWRAFAGGWLWRPLLDTPRATLRDYARAHALDWIEDPGNADLDLDRNLLRHRVLPLLRTRWPQADAGFARSARLQGEATQLLDAEDAAALAAATTVDAHVLRSDALRALPGARRARVLRRWVSNLGLPALPSAGVDAIQRDLLDAGSDAQPCFRWSGAQVQAWRGLLHAGRIREPLPARWSQPWTLRAPLQLPTGDWLAFDSASDDMPRADSSAAPPAYRVHARQGGERIVLPGRAHSHALKHVLQALGVPPWERARLPLLSDMHGTLLAAGDLVYSAGFDAWLRARSARLLWTHARA